MTKLPPSVDGVASFAIQFLEDGTNNPSYDVTKSKDIQGKLTTIQTSFVATDDQPVCDTFYLVSTYNKANVGSEVNGDTAQYLLSLLSQGA